MLSQVTEKLNCYSCERDLNCESNGHSVKNTVSKVNADGNACLMIENNTDDILTIPAGLEVAEVKLLNEQNEEVKTTDKTIYQSLLHWRARKMANISS